MSTNSSIPEEFQHTKAFTFRKISKRSISVSEDLRIFEIMKSCQMLNVVEVASFDFPNFPEAKKKFNAIYFIINPSFASINSLFRGLISLGRPLGVIIEYTSEKKQFTLKYYDSDEDIAKAYLNKIIQNIVEEIRFKCILTSILQHRLNIELEESLTLKKLFA